MQTRMASRRRRLGSRGQSLVEFSLVLPVFLLLVAGMVDFGMGLYSNITVLNAAREGARVGITDPGDVSAVQARVTAMASGLDTTGLTVSTTCQHAPVAPATAWTSCGSPSYQAGDAVVVTVNYTYHMIWPLMFGTTIPMSSTVRMRIE